MGDMGEVFSAMKEHNKKMRTKRNAKYEPLLKKIGAIEKADGVWEYGADWFCYPTKGFAMHKKNHKKMNLDKFINFYSFDDCLQISENDYDMYL